MAIANMNSLDQCLSSNDHFKQVLEGNYYQTSSTEKIKQINHVFTTIKTKNDPVHTLKVVEEDFYEKNSIEDIAPEHINNIYLEYFKRYIEKNRKTYFSIIKIESDNIFNKISRFFNEKPYNENNIENIIQSYKKQIEDEKINSFLEKIKEAIEDYKVTQQNNVLLSNKSLIELLRFLFSEKILQSDVYVNDDGLFACYYQKDKFNISLVFDSNGEILVANNNRELGISRIAGILTLSRNLALKNIDKIFEIF